KSRHVPAGTEARTRRERQAGREAVAAQRRAIKKAARRDLKQQLLEELEESKYKNRDHRSRLQQSCFALCDRALGIRVGLMRRISLSVFGSALPLIALTIVVAQSPSGRNPDVSNKALITKSTPSINEDAFKNQTADAAAAALHKMADDYYAWRNENYPVRSSDAGLHTWDDRLTDYSPAKIAERAQNVRSLLDKAR